MLGNGVRESFGIVRSVIIWCVERKQKVPVIVSVVYDGQTM
jgi:hypothetical protein